MSAPIQPHRVDLDETTTDNTYPRTLGQLDPDLERAVLNGTITLRRAQTEYYQRLESRIYIEVSGCNTTINGERGVTVGFTHHANTKTGAFVRLDDRPAMLYVELGHRTGERLVHAQIGNVREIDRDEFDRLNGIDRLRNELGWKL